MLQNPIIHIFIASDIESLACSFGSIKKNARFPAFEESPNDFRYYFLMNFLVSNEKMKKKA